MAQTKYHTCFKLNNTSFSSVDELLAFSNNLESSIFHFLSDWFSESDYIKLKTSGSTGKPKEIQLKKKQMINSALATGVFFNVKENTKALLCLSVDYIAGKMMLVRALTLGWHLDITTAGAFPLKNVINEYDFAAMVPLQAENSIDNLHRIHKLIIGGGVVSNFLYQKLQLVSTQVYATYGMTETITHIAVKKLNNTKVKPNYYMTLPEVEIFIDSRKCLVIKAPKLCNQLIVTNDVVNLIADNQFEWLGRYDNVINSGGIKLHPEKIEKKLSKVIHTRFFVAGLPDAKFGQNLILVIEGNKTDISLNDAFLLKYEKPKQIFFIKMFVETETKKIQRKKTLDLIK